MNLSSLVDHLTLRLKEPLPGRKAQLSIHSEKGLLEYEKRFKAIEEQADHSNSRQSSVLILLYEKDGMLHIPLIQRQEYEGVHSGQIALPGGKSEPEDKDVIETALRETFEEIGIKPSEVTILGLLTPVFIAPSRFWVNVVLAYHSATPTFIPEVREVAEVIEFPLKHLNETNVIEEREVIRSKDFVMKAPGYVFENRFIWGATSMILTELREMIATSKSQ